MTMSLRSSLFCFVLSVFTMSSAMAMPLDSLTLVGVLDLDVASGGSDGKALHFYAEEAVPDLSIYGVGTANNGGGTDGVEYTFPAQSLNAGEHLLLARSPAAMSAYFGACIAEFAEVLEASSAINQNGNDAIELFEDGVLVQTFGDPDVDGSGTDWAYADSWAYADETGEWTVAPMGCTTGETTDASSCPYPLCEESEGIPGCTDVAACNYDSEATVDDLTCTFPGDDCDDGDFATVFDALDENCECSGLPFVPSNALVLTGVIHAGATPKALELYVMDDMETLEQYGIGSAQNGEGTDGVEWTFPNEAAEAGSFIYVANDADAFSAFFGFPATFVDGGAACNFNGNDAIELFEVGIGVDIYGEVDVDGTGADWAYTDGWAYRVNGTGPDGTIYEPSHWIHSDLGVLDGPVANEFSDEPFPTGSYNSTPDAVGEAPELLSLAAFPNPTNGLVRLAAPRPLLQVEAFDALGRAVHQAPARGPVAFIDLSGLQAGTYTIRATGHDGQVGQVRVLLSE